MKEKAKMKGGIAKVKLKKADMPKGQGGKMGKGPKASHFKRGGMKSTPCKA